MKKLDIIDIRQAVKDKQIVFYVKNGYIYCRWHHDNGEVMCVGEVGNVTGRWIVEHPIDHFQPDEYRCSNCGSYYHKMLDECPDCKAKMEV